MTCKNSPKHYLRVRALLSDTSYSSMQLTFEYYIKYKNINLAIPAGVRHTVK